MTIARQPVENRLGSGARARLTGRDAQLDQRNETPMGALPLLVRVATEAPLGSLPAQKRTDERAGENRFRIRLEALVQDDPSSEMADRGFGRCEKQIDRGRGIDVLCR